MPTITLGETTIPYTIEVRPRRQYAAIQVDPHYHVKVLVPPGFPQHRLESLLRERAGWILKHLDTRPVMIPERSFQTGETFSLLGEPITLEVVMGAQWGIERKEDKLVVFGVSLIGDNMAVRVRGLVEAWLMDQANQILPLRLHQHAARLGLFPSQIKIAEYKSRWGYCREDGLIALNWRIVQAPPEICDYVILHELIHLRHPHHQVAFWKAMEAELADYRTRREWLRHNGFELMW